MPPSLTIGFTFTNFNNSVLTLQAIDSIKQNQHNHKCLIVIVDNASSIAERKILSECLHLDDVKIIWSSENLGYFSGLNTGIDELFSNSSAFDAVIIGNNDLLFSSDFFTGLSKHLPRLSRYPVLSPDIITLDGIHQNPHILDTISRFREIIWDIYYLNYSFSRVILFFALLFRRFLSRKDHLLFFKEGDIIQGYGACYILTPRFFDTYNRLWSPGFLMGEEFYITRQLLNNDESVYYTPYIQVLHHDHATVSLVSSKLMWSYAKDAHMIYRFFVNPYRTSMDNNLSTHDYSAHK